MVSGTGVFGNIYSCNILVKVIYGCIWNNPLFEVGWVGRISFTQTHVYSKGPNVCSFIFVFVVRQKHPSLQHSLGVGGEDNLLIVSISIHLFFFFFPFMEIIELRISFKLDSKNAQQHTGSGQEFL